ncbi:DUF2634 domain-containing protein [Paenibacillus sp. ACRRX]|uniref:DUF2634 domain-containing protein n=1 Tax=unclassified Paenibacillus TaxID=185978 RepID=UPI001EF4931B|nr:MULTISPECIES: DUF2634 domain-containing protein [unclassified Paenibacillus]MCG7409036.1 DUF2634 domain-containing protein [Paenibacillus sp. ACRRX]MDK8181964.1 DUF2634 domain-containing protein [Paenibacillus sp. UMB4589-SE434]
MRTWQLLDGDIQLSDGQVAWIDGRDELAQSVRIRMGTRLGEYFFAPEMGLDHEKVLGKQVSEEGIREAIMLCLAEEPRIQSVDDMELEWDGVTRQLIVQLTLTGTDGEEVTLRYADSSGIETQDL